MRACEVLRDSPKLRDSEPRERLRLDVPVIAAADSALDELLAEASPISLCLPFPCLSKAFVRPRAAACGSRH